MRVVPLIPELRQLLLTWKLRSPFTDPDDYVLVTAARGPVQQRNAQRTLAKAKQAAGLDSLEGRLSWHSLRHSAGSVWLTEYGLPVTTVSAMMGHANPSFTLACYGRDPRDTETMVADVLAAQRPPEPNYNLTIAHGAVKESALPQMKSPDFRGFSLERMKGLEPSTFCMASRRSSQLSYIRERRNYSGARRG